jgi:hypothetical protein
LQTHHHNFFEPDKSVGNRKNLALQSRYLVRRNLDLRPEHFKLKEEQEDNQHDLNPMAAKLKFTDKILKTVNSTLNQNKFELRSKLVKQMSPNLIESNPN